MKYGIYVFFSFAIVCGFIGMILSYVWYKKYGKEAHKKQMEEKKLFKQQQN